VTTLNQDVTELDKTMCSDGPRLLAYLDILGFSNLVKADPGAVRSVLINFIDEAKNVNCWNHDYGLINFSDTIVLYARYAGKNESVNYSDLICLTREMLVRMLAKEIPVRGIVTYGEFSVEKYKGSELFWGEALVRAHEAEANEKIVGVYIDDSAIPDLKASCSKETYVDCYDWDYVLMDGGKILINPFHHLCQIHDGESIKDATVSYGDLYSDEIRAYRFLRRKADEETNSDIRLKYTNASKYADQLFENKWNGEMTRAEEILSFV
jgi:hypothetical protein